MENPFSDIFDGVEPLQGFAGGGTPPAEWSSADPTGWWAYNNTSVPTRAPIVIANGAKIRRLATKRYLQFQIGFQDAAGELIVMRGGSQIDKAELIRGWQHAAVDIADIPVGEELEIRFRDEAGRPAEGVFLNAIFLSEDWGRGQRRRLKCNMPFEIMNVLQNGDVSMCICHEWLKAGNVLGSNKDARIGDIWNGRGYQRVRKLFLEGRHEEVCRKEVCLVLRGEVPIMEPSPKAVEAINKGRTIVEHGPIHLQHDVDRGCNLNCIMCRDEKILPQEENVERAVRDVRDALEMKSLERIAWSGAGEVFAMKKITKLLETDIFSSRDIDLGVTTNLTYFDEKLWSRIGHNNLRAISVSADGCSPEIYNKIRVGGDWNDLLENMRFLSSLRRAGKIQCIGWNYTVLRQNISDVAKAIRLAEALGFDNMRFIAQFGELSRTNGNMFEECDQVALDALYDQFEEVKAFEKPWIWVSEVGMRGKRYRTPGFRLDFAQHVHERGGAPEASKSDLDQYNLRRSSKIVGELVADLNAGKISFPNDLSDGNIRFLQKFLAITVDTRTMLSLESIMSLEQRVEIIRNHRFRKTLKRMIKKGNAGSRSKAA